MSTFDRNAFQKEVGVRMTLARKRKHFTQRQVAEGIGIPRATYANQEAGRQRIHVDVVWRTAVFLGISFKSLMPEPIGKGQ